MHVFFLLSLGTVCQMNYYSGVEWKTARLHWTFPEIKRGFKLASLFTVKFSCTRSNVYKRVSLTNKRYAHVSDKVHGTKLTKDGMTELVSYIGSRCAEPEVILKWKLCEWRNNYYHMKKLKSVVFSLRSVIAQQQSVGWHQSLGSCDSYSWSVQL